jgi:hypothetical protein
MYEDNGGRYDYGGQHEHAYDALEFDLKGELSKHRRLLMRTDCPHRCRNPAEKTSLL